LQNCDDDITGGLVLLELPDFSALEYLRLLPYDHFQDNIAIINGAPCPMTIIDQ
jgi:hypothetical protein